MHALLERRPSGLYTPSRKLLTPRMVRFGRGYPMPRLQPIRKRPIAYDTTGTGLQVGGVAGGTSPQTFSNTAAAGSYVVLFLLVATPTPTLNAPTYGGTAMTTLQTVNPNANSASGILGAYGLAGAPGGAQTVSISWVTGKTFVAANCISVANYSAVMSTPTATGSSTSLSSGSVTAATGQIILNALGVSAGGGSPALTSVSGGTNRWNPASAGAINMTLATATATTTFTASTGTSAPWASLSVVLS
jgi:hypothetical protein